MGKKVTDNLWEEYKYKHADCYTEGTHSNEFCPMCYGDLEPPFISCSSCGWEYGEKEPISKLEEQEKNWWEENLDSLKEDKTEEREYDDIPRKKKKTRKRRRKRSIRKRRAKRTRPRNTISLSKKYNSHLPGVKMLEVLQGKRDIIPNFTITHKLGSGGFATVYKAKDPYGRDAALKIPKGIDETCDMSILKKFSKENDIWKKLSHKNIVRFYRGDTMPVPFISMEVMKGGSLKALMKNYEFTIGEATDIFLQLLDALSYAHRMATVHRDIKPENILFTKDGVPKLSDWGIGKFMASQSATKTMGTKGTLSYSSPEQISKKKYGSVDWSTDVFQLGIVFYEMLTGVNPFFDDDPIGIMSKISTEDPEPPSSVNPDIPEELDRIVMRALEKRKEDRWRSGDVMYEKLMELTK